MLGRDKARAGATEHVDTLIGAKVTIQGDIRYSGGLYVEGRIIGSITADDNAQAILTLAESGVIEGELRVPVVIVNGQIKGDIIATERIELGTRARVEGNIHYRTIEMAAGAMITGRLVHDEQPPKQLSAPEPNA